jgi:hypothetical protein
MHSDDCGEAVPLRLCLHHCLSRPTRSRHHPKLEYCLSRGHSVARKYDHKYCGDTSLRA